ncbi:flagellar hook-length control protein FliK [Paracoccus litorisediminis]|nr:flagellar hook-length control protein FliK [Paracoccus litorisediminis]
MPDAIEALFPATLRMTKAIRESVPGQAAEFEAVLAAFDPAMHDLKPDDTTIDTAEAQDADAADAPEPPEMETTPDPSVIIPAYTNNEPQLALLSRSPEDLAAIMTDTSKSASQSEAAPASIPDAGIFAVALPTLQINGSNVNRETQEAAPTPQLGVEKTPREIDWEVRPVGPSGEMPAQESDAAHPDLSRMNGDQVVWPIARHFNANVGAPIEDAAPSAVGAATPLPGMTKRQVPDQAPAPTAVSQGFNNQPDGTTHRQRAATAELPSVAEEAPSDTSELPGATDRSIEPATLAPDDGRTSPSVEPANPPGTTTTEAMASTLPDSISGTEIPTEIAVRSARDTAQGQSISPHHHPLPEPREILRQIAQQLPATDQNQIEITLTPDELGKVRMVVSSGDTVAITVYADNRDTLDLLRRNSDMLARELKDAGFADASLSFGERGEGGQRNPWSENTAGRGAERSLTEPMTEIAPTAARGNSARQIDIRI